MARGKKVIGVGISCLDFLVLWQDVRLPVAENKVLKFEAQGGGMTGTALATVARLGGQAEFWGSVGADWMGELVLEMLRQDGVDVSHARRVEGGRGPIVLVNVDGRTGERQFPFAVGLADNAGAVPTEEALAEAGCLLVDSIPFQSALSSARTARRLGVPVVADLSAKLSTRNRALMECADYLIVSEITLPPADGIQGIPAALEALRAVGPRCVVITRGAQGLSYMDGDRMGELPAFPMEVVDTTGAGDVFHGAFCYGLVEGFELMQNLRFASAAAALKCRHVGGRAGIPSRAEVEAFLAQHSA